MIVENDTVTGKPQLSAEKRALLEKRLKGAVKPATATPRIPRAAKHGKAPLSFAQQRLWFFDNLEPGSPLYNLPSAIRLQGELDVVAVQKTLDWMVQRHESLRTRFVSEDGTPVQIVQEPAKADLKSIDITKPFESLGESALQQALLTEAAKPFDLTVGYLMRTVLFQLGERDHVMLVTMHHIISDSWSLTVFFKEFATVYETVKALREPTVPELPLQYVDYALWQLQGMSGEVMERHWKYWEKQLKAAPPLLELPTEKVRPAQQTFKGSWVTRKLPMNLAAEARVLGKQNNVTQFMLFLTAFNVLVSRITQQTDVVVGSPIAGRTQFETEGIIGFFVNTLVLRTELTGNPSFTEALTRVRNVTLEGFAHQDYPFDKLVEELQPERSPSYSPLVQVLFALNSEETQNLKLEGLSVSALPMDTGTAKFDLIFTVQENAGQITLHAEYNVDIFTETAIARLLGNYETLLASAVARPETKLSDLEIISENERNRLLNEWAGQRTDYPADKSIKSLFEEVVERYGEKRALSFEKEQLTYRELNRRANVVADRLLKCGVKTGDLVVVSCERSLAMVVAVLGIIKVGAGYVSLDATMPEPRLKAMMKDVHPRVILTEEKSSSVLEQVVAAVASENGGNFCQTLILQKVLENSADVANPNVAIDAENIAYVSFTSGSTGTPKGVRVPHRGVVRLVKNTNYAPFGEDEVFLQFAPLAFDASTLEIWGPLLNGGELVVFPPHLPTMHEMAEFIRENKITTLWLTAGLFHQMVEHDPKAFQGLRRVLAGGDVLSPAHVAKAMECCEVINGYGPTENTTFTCCHKVTANFSRSQTIPIGKPIANTDVYVLDENQKLVPIGVTGELYTGGDGLALDYLNAPELTAEKFVQLAVGGGPVKRLYRTGDKVRWLESGVIEFQGRSDSQTKIRGFRVELGEIENALKKHSQIANSVVVTLPNARGDKDVGAYYTTGDGKDVTAEELRVFLRRTLPEYMIPAFFMRVEAFPLNANGKVDKKRLPAFKPIEDGNASKELLEPRDQLERKMVKVWEDVLGVHPVGVQDNFFEMGGHSLLAVKLVSQVEKTFGNRVPVAEVFLRPTVEQLTDHLRSLQPRDRVQHIAEIQGKGSKPPLFLVHGAGGGMFWGYTNISHSLGKDQPIIAFSSQGMIGQEEFKTIEEMAACYVAELRAYQPQGPYYLGGYCFGGNVAYEMARMLEEQGEKVALLALINCVPPNSSYDKVKINLRTGGKFLLNLGYWAGYFLQLDGRDQRNIMLWKAKGVVKRIKRLGKYFGQKPKIDVEEFVDLSTQPAERRELWKTHINALMSHHPRPINGHVTLFRTRGHSLWCSFDESYGWNDLAAGGTTIRYVAGAHESILAEPFVKATANEIRICLQKA
ncbi:MAG TPA: amino acid adenylation domain-containing protein [Verrucomicrobiae bacterium]